ncbi:disintegrin and metalloproteinase domain-containing protein 10 isoform X2 [Cryptotermes secundus]|uniref:disintegrin and metalloproteinase domain-containing protein 10 isoform X2 n=1 Tax=Cryptotermes secundus TaxID=105785 RepID=UPI000CD7CBFB|nr:disintegrin and metalloproteinase domain-containing protein 10 isoform X2 [Cryptotermes secundus]
MLNGCGYIVFLLFLVPCIESATRLNEYIRHYEELTYDHDDVHRSHIRARRSVTRDNAVHLRFTSHGRSFNIRLKRDLSTFSNNLVVVGPSGQKEDLETSHIYHGHIIGEAGSYVFGSIIDGVFEGKIVSPQGSYYVEKVHHYFPKDSNKTFHSVIYSEGDIEDPYEHLRTGHVGGCGISDDTVQWMDHIQNSMEDEPTPPEPTQEHTNSQAFVPPTLEPHPPHNKYSREVNEGSSSHHRNKRATKPREENKNTCSLFIQTDPLIWRHISEQVNNDPEKTREEILSLIAHHVTAVNYIYRDTKFDGRVEHRNIKFEVQRIKIDDDSPCRNPYHGEPNPFCHENIDVSNFLNLHSLGNHEDFCLAYVFTYRDFTGGTLGLAWVASASASGGICEKYKTYTETVGGMYQSTKRSLNTGIITFVNYNSRVPPKVSQLTLAHEIGHNFGSPHDYPQECRPGGSNGNFIMFASATSGDRPNNSKFSSCSIGNISNVLDAIEDNKKRNCFTVSEGAFCGNKIVEAGEECDCGYDEEECTDKCCYPRLLSEKDRPRNSTASSCTRKANAQCSPSEGPCCSSETCSFVLESSHVQCKAESDCSWSSTCNGRTPECPQPAAKKNKTRCNEGTQLCINGECTGSICLEWNLTECFLTSHIIPNIDKRKLCELACQNGTDPGTCRSTSEFAHVVGLPPGGISLRPGSPCDNFQGYCDVFYKCRAVDAEGPLARLKNLLFNKDTLLTVAQWITEYWWAVLLMGIAFIIFMGLFIKCCAVHTPSSNPKKPPARRFSETLRRPINTFRRMRAPHGGGGGGGHSAGGVGRPGPTRGPAHGYGEGRGQYYAPKASAPAASYSRTNHPELYAGAYGGRNAYEMRHHKV